MATTEHVGLMTIKDESGDKKIIYPITKAEAVEGLPELAAQAGAEGGKTAAEAAVDAVTIGCRNLFLNSGEEQKSTAYKVAQYVPSSPLVEGDTYTFTVCLTPAAGVADINLQSGRGNASACIIPVTGTGKQIVSGTAKMIYRNGYRPSDDIENANITIYRRPNDGTVTGETVVHWAKVEKGNKSTDWTPAPEDPYDTLDIIAGVKDSWAENTSDAFVQYDILDRKNLNQHAGEKVIVTFDAKTAGTHNALDAYFRSSGGGSTGFVVVPGSALTSSYKRYSVEFTVPADIASFGKYTLAIRGNANVAGGSANTGTFYIKNVKLEIKSPVPEHSHTEFAPADHTHTGYAAADHTHTGYAAADHTHTGYAAADHTHSYLPLGGGTVTGPLTLGGKLILGPETYGTTFPSNPVKGQLFFKV